MEKIIPEEQVASYLAMKEEIGKIKREFIKNFLVIGWNLKQIKDKELYKVEYQTFKEFIEAENIPTTTAYQTIRIIEAYAIKTPEQLTDFPLPWNRAQMILPALEKTKSDKKREEVIEMAKTTTMAELKEEVKAIRHKATDTVLKAKYSIIGLPEEINLIAEGLETMATGKKVSVIEVLLDMVKGCIEKAGGKTKEEVADLNLKARTLGNMFSEAHEKYRKAKYLFQGAKDSLLCKKLVQTYSLEELQNAIEKFFTAKKRWWGNRYTVGTFFSALNELVGVSDDDKYTKAIKRMEKED